MHVDGYAPFLSMTTRETFLDVGDSIMAAPGPGQYDPGIIGERVKGGSTLANRVSPGLIFFSKDKVAINLFQLNYIS